GIKIKKGFIMNIFKNDDLGKLILRLMIGGLMLFHGVAKLQNGIGFIEEMVIGAGLPRELAYGVYIAEVLAPLLIILGIQVRLAALTVMAVMVGAVYFAHMKDLLELTKHGAWALEVQAFFFMGAMALFFMGSGKYAVAPKRKPKA
ncbi:MAG: GntR family transcriptional regulator, partial [uncultured Sulfurovum sp.]